MGRNNGGSCEWLGLRGGGGGGDLGRVSSEWSAQYANNASRLLLQGTRYRIQRGENVFGPNSIAEYPMIDWPLFESQGFRVGSRSV